MLREADAALYWGKRHGRTHIQLFDPARHGMAEDLRPQEELGAAVSRVAAGPEQLEIVTSLGFDSAQGHLLGRPAPGLAAPDVDLLTLMSGRDGSTGGLAATA